MFEKLTKKSTKHNYVRKIDKTEMKTYLSTSSLISPYYFGDPTIFDKGVSPKRRPKTII